MYMYVSDEVNNMIWEWEWEWDWLNNGFKFKMKPFINHNFSTMHSLAGYTIYTIFAEV